MAFCLFQDQYENISLHTQKGIDFLERYGHFIKDRSIIENDYAKSLRYVMSPRYVEFAGNGVLALTELAFALLKSCHAHLRFITTACCLIESPQPAVGNLIHSTIPLIVHCTDPSTRI